MITHLLDILGSNLIRIYLNELGIVHVLVGEFHYAPAEGCREQHIQTFLGFRHSTQQISDVADEPEVKHSIGLVQHHDLYMRQVQHFLFVIID